MTNKSTTKRALLASVLSLLLCFTMLLGTTFAWFTDSVTSGNNIIQTGNLDVELEYWNGTAYEAVTSTTKLFDDAALWEPGHVEVAYLKVSNLGSLALKYQLKVSVLNEVTGKTVDGADIKLSDHLVFSVVDKAITTEADLYTREQAVAAAGAVKGLNSYSSDPKVLEKGSPADYVALIIYMPADVNNAVNHNGIDIPSITMGVDLFATQAPVENDSFGNNYDDAAWVVANADALVDDQSELDAALANGGLVALTSDIDGDLEIDNVADGTILNFAGKTVSGTVTVAEGQSITINGQGGIAAEGSAPALKVGKDTDVTLSGGTYTSESSAAIAIANVKTEVPMKLTIEEGTTVTAPTLISLDAMSGYAGAEIEINGGDFTATKSGSYVTPIKVAGADVTVNGGNFNAPNVGSYCYFIDVSEKYNTETQTYDVGNVTINGGTFETTADYAKVVYGSIGDYSNRTAGTVTINGGTFKMLGSYGVLTDIGAHVVVNDCTFVTGGSTVFSIGENNDTDRTIEVKGGNYTIAPRVSSTWSILLGSFAGSYPTDTSPVGKVILMGGTINNYICDGSTIGGGASADLVADGYHVVDNGNGTKSVVAD